MNVVVEPSFSCWCRTVEESVPAIRRQSFAILHIVIHNNNDDDDDDDDEGQEGRGRSSHDDERRRLLIRLVRDVQKARQSSREYFASIDKNEPNKKKGTRRTAADHDHTRQQERTQQQMKDHQGHLLGFHQPSLAKYLFRAYICHSQQPWPSSPTMNTSCFKNDSHNMATRLHALLITILQQLVALLSDQNQQQSPCASSSSSRGRVCRSNPKVHYSDSSSLLSLSQSHPGWSTMIPRHKCPLDYFYYHNRHPEVVNCSEHVDRGLLIAIVLDDSVPGLEVLVVENDNNEHEKQNCLWYCPEEELVAVSRRVSSDRSSQSSSICMAILAGDSLQHFCPDIPACVHRVRTPLKGPRLSMSYELRLA